MLTSHTDIYCGVFDSRIVRKNITKSEMRRVECFELELFTEDSGVSYIDGKKYPVRRGMLLSTKPGQNRHSDFPVKCSFIRVFVNENLDGKLYELLMSLPECTYLDNDEKTGDLSALFSRLGAYFLLSSNTKNEQVMINALFFEILYAFLPKRNKEVGSPEFCENNRIVRAAYEYINENFLGDCSLKAVADAVNVSPNYLQTAFTKHIGVSPYEFVLQKRIERAKKLIMAGEKSMLEIAFETGFCSQSHFGRVFKAQTKETPAGYRKRIFSGF